VTQAINTEDPELSFILDNAYQHSPLVRKAFGQEQQYTSQISLEQNALLQQNSVLYANVKNTIDIPTLQLQTLERIDRDLAFVQQLNKALNTYSQWGEADFTWSLVTNKMETILLGAKALMVDTENFTHVLQGFPPVGYENTPPATVFLRDLAGNYGNSKATYLSSAILAVHLNLLGSESKIQDLRLQDYNTWIDNSAIVHVTPIPESLDVKAIAPAFADSSYYFSDPLTPQGLAFVHSGYAFGGHRSEPRYPEGKYFGPEDCSSWIAKITGSEVLFSTIDQLYTYRLGLPEEKRGYIDPDWLTSNYAKTRDILTPVVIEDPLKDIHPGQVFAYRTFDSDDHFSTGVAGHTALVLGVRENGNVVTINYARNMPQVEGFGISEYPWQSTDKKETLFFDVKTQPISLADVLENDPLFHADLSHTHVALLGFPRTEDPVLAGIEQPAFA